MWGPGQDTTLGQGRKALQCMPAPSPKPCSEHPLGTVLGKRTKNTVPRGSPEELRTGGGHASRVVCCEFVRPGRSKALVANRIATVTVDVLQVKQPVLNALKALVAETSEQAT